MPSLRINCDDLGMHGSVNDAIVDLLSRRQASSASIMPVAPGFFDAVGKLRAAGLRDVGVHLSLEAEFPKLPMRPLLRQARSFADEEGMLYRSIEGLGDRLDPGEVEDELLAQVARVRDAGLRVTHVDGHMFFYDRPGAAPFLLEIVKGIGLANRVPVRSCESGIAMIWDGPQSFAQRSAAYREFFETYRGSGIELIVHPGKDLRAMETFTANAERRHADYLVMSREAPPWREALGICLE